MKNNWIDLYMRHSVSMSYVISQWTHDPIITSLLRQNDVVTSFWRNNDVIIAWCVAGLYVCLHNKSPATHDDVIHLCGEFTWHRWIPHTKAADGEFWRFLWSASWINGWVNNREAGDLRHHRAHYDVIAMIICKNDRQDHVSFATHNSISVASMAYRFIELTQRICYFVPL